MIDPKAIRDPRASVRSGWRRLRNLENRGALILTGTRTPFLGAKPRQILEQHSMDKI